MRLIITSFITIVLLAGYFIANEPGKSQAARIVAGSINAGVPGQLQSNSLCTKDERVVFSCPVKRPAKIVSVCASKDLTSEHGYLQYRFGLPGKIELEFPI